MSISSWFPWRLARQHKGRPRPSHVPALRRRTRLGCEQLEDRSVPANFTAATVSDLIADINKANHDGGSNRPRPDQPPAARSARRGHNSFDSTADHV